MIWTTSRRFTLRVAVRGNSMSVKCKNFHAFVVGQGSRHFAEMLFDQTMQLRSRQVKCRTRRLATTRQATFSPMPSGKPTMLSSLM